MNRTGRTGTAPRENVVQKLPYRCPYCDQIVDYDPIELKEGENPIQCPACRKTYIKVVSNPFEDGTAR